MNLKKKAFEKSYFGRELKYMDNTIFIKHLLNSHGP